MTTTIVTWLSHDCHMTITWTVTWLSHDSHDCQMTQTTITWTVTFVTWLSRDCHIIVTWLSILGLLPHELSHDCHMNCYNDYHITVTWLSHDCQTWDSPSSSTGLINSALPTRNCLSMPYVLLSLGNSKKRGLRTVAEGSFRGWAGWLCRTGCSSTAAGCSVSRAPCDWLQPLRAIRTAPERVSLYHCGFGRTCRRLPAPSIESKVPPLLHLHRGEGHVSHMDNVWRFRVAMHWGGGHVRIIQYMEVDQASM